VEAASRKTWVGSVAGLEPAELKQMSSSGERDVMKKGRSTEDQVDEVMRDAKLGMKIEEFFRQNAISVADLANWVEQQEALKPSDARRMKHLEEENRRLRSLVADLTLSNQALKLAVTKSSEV
jgi:putative transposase